MAEGRLQGLTSHLTSNQSGANDSFFAAVPLAEPDAIFNLTAMYQADTSPEKVNLGAGTYRDDNGQPWVLPVVKKARSILLNDPKLNHEYLPITGLPLLVEASARLILGPNSPAIKENRVAGTQAISGTGAIFFGATFLARFYRPGCTVLISDPTWLNHNAIFTGAGFDVQKYTYINNETLTVDLDGLTASLRNAPNGSVVVLHPCAHNPTGVDPTEQQWTAIADIIQEKQHFPFFDCAYQGFASGDVDRDAWAVRHFVDRGFELFVSQSYAKNFGLYGERCGALTVVTRNETLAHAVRSQLAKVSRSIISNPPAFGARIVSMVLNDPELYREWLENLKEMSSRIKEMRQRLYDTLKKHQTPGDWSHIIRQIGMFSFTGLTAPQVKVLQEKYHIYMTNNGRISMAGLNSKNIEYVAGAMDKVVRH